MSRRPNITDRNYEQIFQLMSFALSLLLVFRTNSSYDRCDHVTPAGSEGIRIPCQDFVHCSYAAPVASRKL